MTVPLSGTQHTIRSGDYSAVIASVGATLRSLRHHERDLVVPFEADEVRPASRGLTLAPWPNRIADGRYSFGGTDYQLPLSEPARHNAIHGLAGWLDFEAIDKAAGFGDAVDRHPGPGGVPVPGAHRRVVRARRRGPDADRHGDEPRNAFPRRTAPGRTPTSSPAPARWMTGSSSTPPTRCSP